MKLGTKQFSGLFLAAGALAFAACTQAEVSDPGMEADDVVAVTSALNAVTTGGTAYANQCSQAPNNVPLPVPFSTATVGTGPNKWTQISPTFIDGFTDTSAARTIFRMDSTSPSGLCVMNASADHVVSVICQGATGKACFWEATNAYWNSIGLASSNTPPNVTSTPVVIAGANNGQNFPSAPDPDFSQCTTCHAGENAFITHMNAGHPTNQHSVTGWMPTDDTHWTDPIVPSWWAQNPGPSTSEYPTGCLGCHTTPSSVPLALRGGRFPVLRTAAFNNAGGEAFCTILKAVVSRPASQGGMPPSVADCVPGMSCPFDNDPQVQAMVAACGQATPNAPTNLMATPSSAKVTLNWTKVAGVASFSVYRGTSAGGESTTPIATGLFDPTFADPTVTNGTTYFYKVAAVIGAFTSAKSNEASATPSAGTAVQINCGDNGAFPPFVADKFFSGGAGKTRAVTISTSGVTNPAPVDVYKSQRYASPYSYTIPGFAAGSSHQVRLHFAETNPANNAPNKRKFSVAINGTTQISNLDLFATVGLNHAYIKEFTLNANSSGQYVLSFTASLDSATISGIEVL